MRNGLGNQNGAALIIALMSMMLLTALGVGVIMVTNTETMISANYRNGQEALYAADAAVERVVQDLLMIPRWNDILAGSEQSSFVDGSMTATKTLPGGGQLTLCCGTNTATGQLQAQASNGPWAGNNPQWKLFAWGPLNSILPDNVIDSRMYVVVWVGDDPADGPSVTVADNNPLLDANGTLTLHAEAYGPGGTHKVVEVTVARTATTEIERGQIAQRGQEELNQRARKAAVQKTGGKLTGMRMNTGTGGLVVQ